ncbi:hypothetical protein [Sphingomonas sp. IC-56]|uniref:hypothetical protein n=1 Tax=Sphingomonas sp. IC-56 TaxID=2898529 RepID=UPI001E40B58B|nr:hypothetical protein [Sphingomonas sp. IC-56]
MLDLFNNNQSDLSNRSGGGGVYGKRAIRMSGAPRLGETNKAENEIPGCAEAGGMFDPSRNAERCGTRER